MRRCSQNLDQSPSNLPNMMPYASRNPSPIFPSRNEPQNIEQECPMVKLLRLVSNLINPLLSERLPNSFDYSATRNP